MAAKLNLVINQGEDYRRALELRDEFGAVMDLTGYTFRGQIKGSYADSSPVMSFSFALRNQVTEKGFVDLHLPASASAAVAISKEASYLYDVEMVDASGDVRRILEGKVKLSPEVTK